MNSQTTVMMSLSILVSVAITASCAILLFGFYRSQKRKRSNVAVTTLVFSNGLYGAIALPIWIYLMYRTGPLHPLPKKLYIAYMVIDITLTVATTLQLLFISYEQLRIKMRPTFHFTDKTTKCLLLLTWTLGLVAAITQAFIRTGTTAVIFITAFLLVPFLFMVIFFLCMLFTKKNPDAAADQQYEETTRTGLVVLSCLVCLMPFAVGMVLFHMKIAKLPPFVVEVMIVLRYLNALFTTAIHGYKSVELGQDVSSAGNKEVIIHVHRDSKNLAVISAEGAGVQKKQETVAPSIVNKSGHSK